MPPTPPDKPDPNKNAKAASPGKPPAGKPVPQKKEPAKKADAPRPKAWAGDSGNRKFGQVLVDLGYLDEPQLDELLFEVRSTEIPLEQMVLDRGLVSAEQLLQAKAEQFGLKVCNLDEAKPSPEALK